MDSTRVHASFLVEELAFYVGRAQGMSVHQIDNIDLSEDWEAVLRESEELHQLMKNEGLYFRDGISVFSEYKNLKESVVPRGGMRAVAEGFDYNLPKDEIWSRAVEVIQEWNSAGGVERKK